MATVTHPPLAHIRRQLDDLRRSGIELEVADDGQLSVKRSPANLELRTVYRFLESCGREIHGVLAAGETVRLDGVLESVRWEVEVGKRTEERPT